LIGCNLVQPRRKMNIFYFCSRSNRSHNREHEIARCCVTLHGRCSRSHISHDCEQRFNEHYKNKRHQGEIQKISWPPKKNSLNKKASWVRIAETSCIGPCLQSLIDINFESCASATVVSRKALYFKTAAVIISTSHQMTMTTNTSGGFRNYRRRRAEPGKEVSQRGPGAEPRWGSEVEAPRSWRHILKITIANIISRDRCINTHRVP